MSDCFNPRRMSRDHAHKAQRSSRVRKPEEKAPVAPTLVRLGASAAAGGEFAAFVGDSTNTIATQLLDRLREAIVSGQLKAGSKINLSRARESFGVSLSPLREALARLIADGLVEFEDNRGYWVAPVSLANLAEITQLRAEMESMALRHAMVTGDLNWESDVMRSLHRLNRTIRDPAV